MGEAGGAVIDLGAFEAQWDDAPVPPDPDEGTTWGTAESGESSDSSGSETAIQHRLQWLRVNHEARVRLDDEIRPPVVLPTIKSLTTLLDEPDVASPYRIEHLAPANGRVLLSAQKKSGKTTLRDNLVHAFVDEFPFLGHFGVNQPPRRLVLIDDELDEAMMRRWLRAHDIRNTDRVADVVSLRGRVATLNLLDDRTRSVWARRLRDLGCDYLILDCLRPVLDALGLDENRDAGRFLVAFDALLAESGIGDALLIHHMGHNGERSRGDSRLGDWPDANWKLVRENDEPCAPRYFTADGRDVSVPEGRLTYDPRTRRLTYASGSRTDAKTEAAYVAVINLLATRNGEPLSKSAIEEELAGEHTQKTIRAAIARTVDVGAVTTADGPRGAKLHRITHPCDECGMPVTAGGQQHESCSQSRRGGSE